MSVYGEPRKGFEELSRNFSGFQTWCLVTNSTKSEAAWKHWGMIRVHTLSCLESLST